MATCPLKIQARQILGFLDGSQTLYKGIKGAMRDDVHRYIVAYDISNDKIRTRVSKVLKSYGSRAQFSVFLVDLSDVKAQRMTASVEGNH